MLKGAGYIASSPCRIDGGIGNLERLERKLLSRNLELQRRLIVEFDDFVDFVYFCFVYFLTYVGQSNDLKSSTYMDNFLLYCSGG